MLSAGEGPAPTEASIGGCRETGAAYLAWSFVWRHARRTVPDRGWRGYGCDAVRSMVWNYHASARCAAGRVVEHIAERDHQFFQFHSRGGPDREFIHAIIPVGDELSQSDPFMQEWRLFEECWTLGTRTTQRFTDDLKSALHRPLDPGILLEHLEIDVTDVTVKHLRGLEGVTQSLTQIRLQTPAPWWRQARGGTRRSGRAPSS